MGFGQSSTNLLGDGNRFSCRQLTNPRDRALQVLSGYEFHGDVVSIPFSVQVVHAADVRVPDLPGKLQLVPKTLDRLFIRSDLRFEELEGNLLVDFFIQHLVDLPHTSSAQLLDHLEPPRKNRPCLQFYRSCLESFCWRRGGFLCRMKWFSTVAAEFGIGRILEITFGTFHAQFTLFLLAKEYQLMPN
ncbi:hypothetical protein ES703_90144 [subsurface metagenome]